MEDMKAHPAVSIDRMLEAHIRKELGAVPDEELRAAIAGMVKRNEEDDLLHELVEGMTGKKSIKALTYGEACKVIGELEGRQGTPPPRKSGKPLRKTAPGHTSEGQRRKVWALMYRLQDASPSKAPLGDRLCAIIKKELGMDAFPKDPFAWISYKDGNKLVEVLKGYVKTAQKSRGDADG